MRNQSDTDIKRGNLIRCCREKMGMTQEQLAEKVGVSVKSVSKWETGVCRPLKNQSKLYLTLGIDEPDIVFCDIRTQVANQAVTEKLSIEERRIRLCAEAVLVGLGAILFIFAEQMQPVVLYILGMLNVLIGTMARYVTKKQISNVNMH